MFARVIVDIVHSGVDRVFEYAVPEGLQIETGFRVHVPFGKGNALKEGYVLSLSDSCEYDESLIKPIHSVISDFPALTPGQIRLAYMVRRYYHTTLACALRLMFPAQMRGKRVKDRFERELVCRLEGEDFIIALEALKKSPKQKAVLEAIANKPMNTQELGRCLPGSASARDALIKKDLIQVYERETFRMPLRSTKVEPDYTLASDQQNAVDVITSSTGKYLLHGVTGSGKTEVYIRIVRDCLAKGKTAIVLVPEISLTPQLVEMFERRIGEEIAVYHSTLSAGERYDEWKRMMQGRARVVVGARSAVFAPLRNVGAIIIDEEHETSYRSDMHPRYTAHEIARMRAAVEDASLVLASATPSVESYIKARNGIYRLVEMPSRLFGLKLPAVQVVDMREEILRGNRTIFSARLYDGISETLAAGRQAMLFVNRRGYSTFVMCRGCGYVEYCDECAVTMTHHTSPGALVCHYCGRKRPLRAVCPACNRPYLKQFGVGTQQVEAYAKACFPEARVLRMDLDTTRGKNAHQELYAQFKSGGADILIGTQMIAKGFDFENVKLVGVVSADCSLYIPDYRSPEKTFQLLEQVAGRAGRKNPGQVIIQTYSPEHYAIQRACSHDFAGYFDEEMAVRRSALLPPYTVFFRIVFAGKNEAAVREACFDFERGFREAFADMMDRIPLLDASEAPVKKLQGSIRWQVLFKALNDERLAELRVRLYDFMEEKQYKDCAFGLEINPQSMM
jgi:primosomal protein N' (replication factor Y)